MSSEAQIHEAVCNYIRLQYPKVLFNSDMSGVRLTKGQAVKAAKLRSSKGFPDIAIYEPQFMGFAYYGLFLELKKEGTKLYKKDKTPATKHIQDQQEIIDILLKKGYYAAFACGFDEAKKIIDRYFNGHKNYEILKS